MLSKEEINDFIVRNLKEGHFVIDVQVSTANVIQIFVDSFDGVTIADCVYYTRLFEETFDREQEDYELSVSSGGIDLPLKVDLQFEKNLGGEVEVVANDGLKYTGLLVSYNAELFELEYEQMEMLEGKKRKQAVTKNKTFNRISEVKSVKPVFSFKKNKKK
ncbi:MAG: ribosome assembly cofactor RimP [Bacteroidales bacterium]|nr:ribosome assembly cofactor RimP [Bacteroidales bacterium]